MSRRTLLTLFALLSLAAATAWAQSQARIVRLSYLDGDVQLDRNDAEGFSKAFLNMPITRGMRVSTGSDGYAEAELDDGSAIRLAPNSVMEFTQLERDNTGTQTTVNLTQGEAYFNWKQNHSDQFRVRVGDQLFTAKKKSHFRLTANGDDSAVAVFNGELEMFRTNGERIDVKKNETLSLSMNDESRYFLAKNISPDALDDWDHDRQSDLDREQAAQANAYASLNQYGSYITVPNYGSVWRPAGFGYAWDPYQDGSWVWYPSNGYVWVSSYPWGWAPYRYGSWVYVNNVGWCWQRGSSFNGWNATPVLVHPPGGFRPPRPPERRHEGIILVGRPPHDFDNPERHHHPDPVVVGATSVRPATAPASNVNLSAQPRTDRPVRLGENPRPADGDGFQRGNARPARVNPPAAAPATSPAIVSTPRASRTDRSPSQPATPETRGRNYAPPQSAAPAPSQQSVPRYSPPPSAPPSQPQHSSPPPSYSPPPSQPHNSPPPSPPPSAPAESRGRANPK